MSDIHPNVVRVTAAAKERGLDISTRRFPEGTKTAADAAAAIGVTVGQIVKSGGPELADELERDGYAAYAEAAK